jgi:hypothetical protein
MAELIPSGTPKVPLPEGVERLLIARSDGGMPVWVGHLMAEDIDRIVAFADQQRALLPEATAVQEQA